MGSLAALLKEARRRRVFRTVGIYIVAAWVGVQVFSEIFPALDIPANAIRYVWIGALIGLPLALIFGWRYDLTPAGIVRTASPDSGEEAELGLRRTDFVLLGALGIVAIAAIYQLTGQVRIQRGEPAAATMAVADPLSVAVLPLENLSGDPGQLYFANGIHDALTSDLSRISGLRVTSRTSMRAYAGTDKPAGTICAELGVANLIEGSVSRIGKDLRVNVHLIDCATDNHIWSRMYDREVSDVLIMQSEIARAVARQVEVALTRDEAALLADTEAVDPAAYEAYLKGVFHLELLTPQDMQLADEFFARALEIDPDSALAHWGLGRTCRFQLQFGHGRPRDRASECQEHLLAALAIDPDLPQVHLGLAFEYWLYDYDWEAARVSFERALDLNPNYAEAHVFFSHLLATLHREDESDRYVRRALELDPMNVFVQGLHAAQRQLVGRYDEAIARLDALHDKVPGFGFGYEVLWYSNYRVGNLEAALEAAKSTYAIMLGMPGAVEPIDTGYETGGYDVAMRQVGAWLEEIAATRYVSPFFIAVPFAMGGDPEKAVDWLERGFDERDPMMPYLGTAPAFGRIETDPGYRRLLERMDLQLLPTFPDSP